MLLHNQGTSHRFPHHDGPTAQFDEVEVTLPPGLDQSLNPIDIPIPQRVPVGGVCVGDFSDPALTIQAFIFTRTNNVSGQLHLEVFYFGDRLVPGTARLRYGIFTHGQNPLYPVGA